VLVALSLATAPLLATASAAAVTTPAPPRDPSAAAAHADALTLLRQGDPASAVARLDLAIELEPNWTAPLQLRAEAFAALAHRYRPSEAFLAAQAADLERLVQLEPGVDRAARQQQVAALRLQSREARVLEQRRRDLTRPAIFMITASAVTVVSGGLLLGFIPATTSDAYAQRRFVAAGASMLAVGVALAVPAITLGVLAGRQGKRDSALAEFSARTDRPRADLAVAPLLRPGAGGLNLRLRF